MKKYKTPKVSVLDLEGDPYMDGGLGLNSTTGDEQLGKKYEDDGLLDGEIVRDDFNPWKR